MRRYPRVCDSKLLKMALEWMCVCSAHTSSVSGPLEILVLIEVACAGSVLAPPSFAHH